MAYVKSLQFMIFDNQSDLTGLTADTGQFAFCKDVQLFFNFNGTNWIPSTKTLVKKSAVVVTGTSTGNTKIYTMEPSALNFYPTMVIMRAVNISGVTIRPTVSVGTNATNYDNIVSASLLSTLLSSLGAGSGAPQLSSVSIPIAGGTDIYAKVSIAAAATSYTFTIEIIGFYDT